MLMDVYRTLTEPNQSRTEHFLVDYLESHTCFRWDRQIRIDTPFTHFFVDMACTVEDSRSIGVECDGREFHDDPAKELCRDALILNSGRINRIFHIESWAIKTRMYDWLSLLSFAEPQLFKHERHRSIGELREASSHTNAASICTTRFMYCRDLVSAEVAWLLELAGKCTGHSYKQLVQRVRSAMNEGHLMRR